MTTHAHFAKAPEVGSLEEKKQFDNCVWYYERLEEKLDQADNKEEKPHRRFYVSHLLDVILKRCKEKLVEPAFCPTHFVTIISKDNWHLSALTTLLAREQAVKAGEDFQCLLLHTPDEKANAQACAEFLEKQQPEIECNRQTFRKAKMAEDLGHLIEKFTRGVARERVAFDLKPGTKKMTYWMARLVQPGNWILNLDTDFNFGFRPGSEIPEDLAGCLSFLVIC